MFLFRIRNTYSERVPSWNTQISEVVLISNTQYLHWGVPSWKTHVRVRVYTLLSVREFQVGIHKIQWWWSHFEYIVLTVVFRDGIHKLQWGSSCSEYTVLKIREVRVGIHKLVWVGFISNRLYLEWGRSGCEFTNYSEGVLISNSQYLGWGSSVLEYTNYSEFVLISNTQ